MIPTAEVKRRAIAACWGSVALAADWWARKVEGTRFSQPTYSEAQADALVASCRGWIERPFTDD